jgi:hypothetical protein
VPPLAEPEAIELFCTRAQLEPDETIAELCRRLDELPLGLELAAARTSVLSPAQILGRLAQSLDLLKGGRDAEARQRTLRATIEWSYDLLDDEEQHLFARLAVFRGGCTLEAAQTVADADIDILHSLVDKSLLRHTQERFWMLETIREYARERLAESGEEAELRREHAAFFLAHAETAWQATLEGGDQVELFGRLAAEHENLRAALEWARDLGKDETLLRLAAALRHYWSNHGYHQETDVWLPLALERGDSPLEARIEALRGAAVRAAEKGDYARSDELIAEWHSLAEQAGNEIQALTALNAAARNATSRGDFVRARAQLVAIRDRAVEIGNQDREAAAIVNLAVDSLESGDLKAALAYASEGTRLFRELGDDGGLATGLILCGATALVLSEISRSEESFREALVIGSRLGRKRAVFESALGLGVAFVAEHQEERGVKLLAAAARLGEEFGVVLDWDLLEDRAAGAVVDAKVALGEEAFAAAWARGHAMTAEEIVASVQERT